MLETLLAPRQSLGLPLLLYSFVEDTFTQERGSEKGYLLFFLYFSSVLHTCSIYQDIDLHRIDIHTTPGVWLRRRGLCPLVGLLVTCNPLVSRAPLDFDVMPDLALRRVAICFRAWRAYCCPGSGSFDAILLMAACAFVKTVPVMGFCSFAKPIPSRARRTPRGRPPCCIPYEFC